MGRKQSRKAKSAAQIQIEADQRKRNGLIASGVPAHQVQGQKVHEYETNVRHIRKPVQNIVDKWMRDGGLGFDEPQRRAIDHCRALWQSAGSEKLVANLDWIGGGGGGREGGLTQTWALTELALYRDKFKSYWTVFEDIVRWNISASVAGEHMALHNGQRIERCKKTVAFVASKIAEANGY